MDGTRAGRSSVRVASAKRRDSGLKKGEFIGLSLRVGTVPEYRAPTIWPGSLKSNRLGVVRREIVFAVGCAKCHTPRMITEESSNLVFYGGPVPLSSDLLLHDIGTGDGIPRGEARGVSYRQILLHHGTATSPEGVRPNYDRLAMGGRRAVLAFRNTI